MISKGFVEFVNKRNDCSVCRAIVEKDCDEYDVRRAIFRPKHSSTQYLIKIR